MDSPNQTGATRCTRVLLVDDSVDFQRLVAAHLKSSEFEFRWAESGPAALRMLASFSPDVILLDVDMPGMDGYDVCRRIRECPDWMAIQIIFLTVAGRPDQIARGLDAGGNGYLTKPHEPNELVARVRVAARIKELHDRLAHQAQIDGMTGLSNRTFFHRRLNEELERSRRHSKCVGLVLIDIDNFKMINDSHGHLVGDEVIKHFSAELRRCARQSDVVARLGGDEFAMLLPEQDLSGACQCAERIRRRIGAAPFVVNQQEYALTASLGVASLLDSIPDPLWLISRCDEALYLSKTNGRNRVSLWSGSKVELFEADNSLDSNRRESLRRDDVSRNVQPAL